MSRLSFLFLLSLTVLLFSCSQDSTPTMPEHLNQMSANNQMNSGMQAPGDNGSMHATQGQGVTNHSEQIVFSGTGSSTLGPFGFWVWSQDADSRTPYHGEAAGALYLYALGITSGVEGEVEETSEGIYQITVESRRPGGIDAILTNEGDPIHGPHNIVDVTFTSPSAGTGQSTNAAVNITGPSE
jgi:hypothetical protein